MRGKGSNYQPQIHDEDYAADYRAVPLDSRGLVDASGRETESLNGEWRFGVDWYDTCLRSRWFLEHGSDAEGRPLPLDYDWEAGETMAVPSCWNMKRDELRYFEGSGVYPRTFRCLPRSAGERAFLRFEGAQYRATVFLNGACLGTHDGGSTPFCAEITGIARPENRIIVVVEARRRSDRVPAENTDWFHYGGIYRDVLLLRTPPVLIRDWFLRLVPDGGFRTVALDFRVLGAGSARARLRIPDLDVDVSVTVLDGAGSARIRARPELWSPDSPRLYGFELECGDDRVRDRVGFRQIGVEGGTIVLNGEPLYLKGICVHEDHLTMGKTTDEATIHSTIAHVKELNANYVRLAHYPHDSRFARIADEEGGPPLGGGPGVLGDRFFQSGGPGRRGEPGLGARAAGQEPGFRGDLVDRQREPRHRRALLLHVPAGRPRSLARRDPPGLCRLPGRPREARHPRSACRCAGYHRCQRVLRVV
jgi:beta-glucuronidase